MKKTTLLPLICSLGVYSLSAQPSATTPAQGSLLTETVSVSDLYCSVPFEKAVSYQGAIRSVEGGTLALENASFVEQGLVYAKGSQPSTYYAQFLEGPKEGEYYTITANTADVIILELNGDTLDGVAPGTRVKIVPFWTLESLFPDGLQEGTELHVPNLSEEGINLPAEAVYIYEEDTWKKKGEEETVADTMLYPDVFFVLRETGETGKKQRFSGVVPKSAITMNLSTSTTGEQDNPVALYRPGGRSGSNEGVSLKDSGLVSSGAFSASTGVQFPIDRLLVFDNSQIGFDRAPTAEYLYLGAPYHRWVTKDNGEEDRGEDIIFTPGNSVIIRYLLISPPE